MNINEQKENLFAWWNEHGYIERENRCINEQKLDRDKWEENMDEQEVNMDENEENMDEQEENMDEEEEDMHAQKVNMD